MKKKFSHLAGKYNASIAEQEMQKLWKDKDIYQWNPNQLKDNNFVIDTPPPTVSGILHMGHVFSYTHADFIARYQRMMGKNVFYPIGFDDNGLPTERLVEKTENIRAIDQTREEFIETCSKVVKNFEEGFRKFFTSIALSVDWSQEYQTISLQSTKISQMSFLDLYEKGYIYREEKPVIWDISDKTALAKAEIEDANKKSQMHYVSFTLKHKNTGLEEGHINIMTTRPELLPACVALMCHPNSYETYKDYNILTPLFNVELPIISDENVDEEKGTGFVMCCTFGDETDILWWKKHSLDTKVILSKSGYIENIDGMNYADELTGLNIKQARAKILELLETHSYLFKESEDIEHSVKVAERSKVPIEFLITKQWFVKLVENKDLLLKQASKINWRPENMEIRIRQWIEGLNSDWCISRQRFFGVPFPVWYSTRQGEEGKILLPKLEDLPVNPLIDLPKGYSRDEVIPDYDVMDTWATSSVSPQLSAHGISENYVIDKTRYESLFPADLRPQAHEIIRSWAFYTIVKSTYHENKIPWKNIMISGWCLDKKRQKMSKSKGNVITPIDIIESHGSDIIRYWTSTSSLGSDTAYHEEILKIGQKLVNKIWNSSKFVSLHMENLSFTPDVIIEKDIQQGKIEYVTDIWILQELRSLVINYKYLLSEFDYFTARQIVEEFFWDIFCDTYIELVKKRCYDKGKFAQSGICTLYHVLLTLLKLFAPFVPYVTDYIYQNLFIVNSFELGNIISLHQRGSLEHFKIDEQNDAYYDLISFREVIANILEAVRKYKTENQLGMNSPIDTLSITICEELLYKTLLEGEIDLKNVTHAQNLKIIWDVSQEIQTQIEII